MPDVIDLPGRKISWPNLRCRHDRSRTDYLSEVPSVGRDILTTMALRWGAVRIGSARLHRPQPIFIANGP
jgi:hypothetical protein